MKIQKILAAIAALTLVCGAVPAQPFADMIGNMAIVASAAVDLADYTQIDDSDAYYKIVDNTIYIDGLAENTAIPAQAFRGKKNELPEKVTNVKIGKNITSIGTYAFASSKSLQTVNMPNVTFIDKAAFLDCTSLKTISMPNVENIKDWAFESTALTSVEMPKLTSIGQTAFAVYETADKTNTTLTTIKLGETVPEGFEEGFKYNTTATFLIPVGSEANYAKISGFAFETYVPMEFGNYVKGIGFTLDGKIGVNLQTTEKPENFTVTCGEKKIPVVANNDDSVSFYIAPKEMVKEYTIEVNNTTKTITPVDIVTLYTAADKNSELAQYADLAQSLADYCKAADAYFDGDETTKVELPEYVETRFMEELEKLIEIYGDKVPDDENTYKTSLVLDSETAFKIYVSNPNGISLDDVDASEGVKTQISKNTVTVKISNLSPAALGASTFTVNGGTFSALGYMIKALAQTEDEDLTNLCFMLIEYVNQNN